MDRKGGAIVGRPRKLFDAAVEIHRATWVESNRNDLQFPDASKTTVYCNEGPEIHGVMVNHFRGQAFFDFLFDLMRTSDAVLYWPGSPNVALIAPAHLSGALPADMAGTLGRPHLIINGAEILAAIKTTTSRWLTTTPVGISSPNDMNNAFEECTARTGCVRNPSQGCLLRSFSCAGV